LNLSIFNVPWYEYQFWSVSELPKICEQFSRCLAKLPQELKHQTCLNATRSQIQLG
jgi:hypothetical protein